MGNRRPPPFSHPQPLDPQPVFFCDAWVWSGDNTTRPEDPNRCYLKSAAALNHKRSAKVGWVAGYPGGAPPPDTPSRWYNDSRTVDLVFSLDAPSQAATSVILRTINSTCANPKALWQLGMHSVTWPSKAQLSALQAASTVCEERIPLRWSNGSATLSLTLPAYAAASAELEW